MTSRVDRVTELLGAEICAGALPEGSVVTAESVQTRTGTSRTAVRESLSVLVSLGLLRVRRRIGYEVCGVAEWSLLSPEVLRWRLAGSDAEGMLRDLMALRILIEPSAAAAAAERADDEERAVIARAAGEMWAAAVAGDRDGFLEADVRFHRALLQGGGNSIVSALGELLAESLPPRAPDAESISLGEARAHLDLADAVLGSDAAEAARLADAIVRRTA